MKVLIADDTLSVLMTTSALIRAEGHDVVAARDGKEAVEVFKRERPDLVLLDVIMPGLDGYEVARRIRAQCGDNWIPIVFLSAMAKDEDIARGIEAGGDDYLTKPIGPIVLNAKLRAMQRIADMRKRLELANRELQMLSHRDGLTGIANRRYFDETLRREWARARRAQHPLSLLLIDIDHFKGYNDAFGHLKGDECLIAVARQIAATAERSTDLVARYGGEEFGAMLPETDQAGAAILAERIRRGVEDLRLCHPQSTVGDCVTLSIGAATEVPQRDFKPTQLIAAADTALYRAKQTGRNRVIRALAA